MIPGDFLNNCLKCGGLLDKNEKSKTWAGGAPKFCNCSKEIANLKPIIVCLCGSTKFYKEFFEAAAKETFAGKIVLSVGYFGHASHLLYEGDWKSKISFDGETKKSLDELHKQKIDLADEVLILDVNGYIGDSTKSEIEYAILHNKKIRYLSKENKNE